MARAVSLDVHPIVEELSAARTSEGAMKAATMTLAVFFETPAIASWVVQRTRAIAEKHPSRVLMFDGTKSEGDQHAEPSMTRGEWVDVGVKGSSAAQLASALSLLALAEAPIVLAWVGMEIEHDERFVALANVANTVVVSTSVIDPDTTALRDLVAFVERHPAILVQDVAYLRLTAWQELIAEFFDEPEFLVELAQLCEVRITGGSDPEMYYLLGWLASRLEWTPCAPDEMCNALGETVRFCVQREGTARRLSSVVLTSKDVTFTASVTETDPEAVCLQVAGAKERAVRCAPLHTLDIASLIERAILTNAQDEIFLESLAMAKLILDRKHA